MYNKHVEIDREKKMIEGEHLWLELELSLSCILENPDLPIALICLIMYPWLHVAQGTVVTHLIVMVMELEDDSGIYMNLMTCAVIIIQDLTNVVCILTGMIIMDTEEGAVEHMAIEWTIAAEMEFLDVVAIILVAKPVTDIKMKDHEDMYMDAMLHMVVRAMAIIA